MPTCSFAHVRDDATTVALPAEVAKCKLSRKELKSRIHLCKKFGYHPKPRYTSITKETLETAPPPKVGKIKFEIGAPKAIRKKRMGWKCVVSKRADNTPRLEWYYVVVE